MIHTVRTATLAIACEMHGPSQGEPIVLLHGFPYDPRCFDQVAPALAADGNRVIVPYLRGYGPTRFLSPATMRSGQQAALAQDLLDLLDSLHIGRATLMGYDWGGRAACIAAALWPDRVRCLVTGDGYNIQNIAASATPASAENEHRYWYQYYFHTERGRAGLQANRAEIARLLWRLWSPNWRFTDAENAITVASFDNPDFVDVVIHSYRHRYTYAPGDPSLEPIEQKLVAQPAITVPTISLCGADDGVSSFAAIDDEMHLFTASYERRVLPGIGHNIPQEAPAETLKALRDLLSRAEIPTPATPRASDPAHRDP